MKSKHKGAGKLTLLPKPAEEGEMELGVKDRVVLLAVLSGAEGNLTEVRVLRELQNEVSFSDEEIVSLGLQSDKGRTVWDPDTEQVKDVEFGEAAKGIIVRKLKELNRQGQLTADHLDLVDKFPEVEG